MGENRKSICINNKKEKKNLPYKEFIINYFTLSKIQNYNY